MTREERAQAEQAERARRAETAKKMGPSGGFPGATPISDAPRWKPNEAAVLRERTSAAALLRLVLPPEERLLGSLVTRTSRMFLVGATGVGKSLLGLAVAGGIASGTGFLNWRSIRPARVIYIDGEMPRRTLRDRVGDLGRRLGGEEQMALLHRVSWEDADTLGIGEWGPLNRDTGQAFIRRLCELIEPDVVIFDNVQALVVGDLKDEVVWTETTPLVAHLTARNIGQIWIDHTGHGGTRQYGTSTKAWRFDSVGIMTPLPREQCAPAETAFTLSFDSPYGKARNRSPETWDEYAEQVIRLRDDRWTTEAANGSRTSKATVRPDRLPFYDALVSAITVATGRPGEATRDRWEDACIHKGLIEARGVGSENERRKPLRRAQSDLIAAGWIAVEGDHVIDLRHVHG